MSQFRAKVVRESPDLKRIQALPRRKLTPAYAARAVEQLTPRLALRKGPKLKQWQAVALLEAVQCKGAWLSLPVGSGKTLVCEGLPVLMQAQRAVLILPASLRSKTYGDRGDLRKDWRLADPPPRLISREELALDANAYLLDQLKPDLIIVDEAHKLRNSSAGAPKRIARYVEKTRKAGRAAGLPWPHGVTVVTMTGTPKRKSLMNYWHLLRWCLEDSAPVPSSKLDAELWAQALDTGTPRSGFRPHPGALGSTREEALAWYAERLCETPGCVVVDEDSAVDADGETIPLHVSVEIAPPCPVIDRAFDDLRTCWVSPSGEEVSDALSLFRIDGATGLGLCQYWDPPPPKRWAAARKAMATFVRKRIAETAHAHKPLDTEGQVFKAHAEHPVIKEWLAVRKTFDSDKASKTRWLSDVTLEWAAEWLMASNADAAEQREPSVLWCGSVAFAQRLSRLINVPNYGPEGVDANTGRSLHAAQAFTDSGKPGPHKPGRDFRMICSWHACREGYNLQDWRRHAVILLSPSAEILEQVIGRAHRTPKPDKPRHLEPMRFTILATSGGTLDAFAAAYAEAEGVREGENTTQKILRATIAELPETPANLRWVTRD